MSGSRFAKLSVGPLSLIFAVTVRAAEPKFDQLIVFAGQENVRVSALFQPGDQSGPVAFKGVITRASNGERFWEGSLGQVTASSGATISLSNKVSKLKPELWSPVSPTLYYLEVAAQQNGKTVASKKVRFGFRSFEAKDGQFLLNGKPVFLKGVAINPPGRGIPENVGETRKFAEDYVRFLKSQNLNIFRISTDESQVWFDVCDEQGMMLYAGRYGAPIASAGEKKDEKVADADIEATKKMPPKDFAKSMAGYKKLFSGFASHPSIVEYYLSNELPVSGERGAAYSEFLTKACAELKKWDDTRPYIGNAGYGMGKEGDVCDVHRYWGWYYNSFLTYYNLRDKLFAEPLFGDPKKNQPLTFTECVGSFTSSSGEFNVVRIKQLAPRQGWIGHTETPREDALDYQAFMVKQACESFRRMRPQNPRLAGLMPFTILFYNWTDISSFDQMKAKPAMDAMRTAYQPVLLSWESWQSQAYAGTEPRVIAHVINDDDRGRALENAVLNYRIAAKDGREFCVGKVELPTIKYFGTWSQPIALKLPKDMPTGEYVVSGTVITGNETRSTNSTPLFVAGGDWKTVAKSDGVFLYDPKGATASAFAKSGVKVSALKSLVTLPREMRVLVIGEQAWDKAVTQAKGALEKFVRDGGRVLCLQQEREAFEGGWLPQAVTALESSPNAVDYPPKTRPFREQMNVNLERPEHPAFAGLNRRRFSLWSDYSNWDQTKTGFPKIYPVGSGFKLNSPEALAHTAVLADYDRALEAIALCEMFDGKGSVILCAFDLVKRIGLDPVADRMLVNLVNYAATEAGHELHPLIEKPIQWGNFPSERGTVCGSLNGLLVNAEWIPAPNGPRGKPLAPNTGAWNMLPGDQFIPQGRNPFGTIAYSTASSLRDPNPEAKSGSGFFWARIPEGKKTVVTKVRNPGKEVGTLTVRVDGANGSATVTVEPNATKTLSATLPAGQRDVCVRFAGQKNLVLLETAFE